MRHKTKEYRRMQEALHKKRLKEISGYCGYPGVYEYKPGCFKSCRSRRSGDLSQYLKRAANKKVRKTTVNNTMRGSYRRVFDYWWELC